MIPPQQQTNGLMVPQILFQCHHCRVALQVPLSFAGQTGPCPQCGNALQTPMPSTQTVASAVVEETQTTKRHANPALTYATDAPSLMGRSFTSPNKSTRSLNRGIMADQSVHHGHEMKRERSEERKMLIWFLLVILFLAAATFLMKSYVVGG